MTALPRTRALFGATRRSGCVRLPRRQRGVALLVALIALVALTLAGIAMVRSVDTAVSIAGNLAFTQTATQSSDQGVQAAFTWLNANSSDTTLQNTDTSSGYYSSVNELDWSNINSWSAATVLNNGAPDAAGNVVRYVIHRMCTQPNVSYNGVNTQCALYSPEGAAGSGNSKTVGATSVQGLPQVYFRVTVRVDGPSSTVNVSQTTILIPAT